MNSDRSTENKSPFSYSQDSDECSKSVHMNLDQLNNDPNLQTDPTVEDSTTDIKTTTVELSSLSLSSPLISPIKSELQISTMIDADTSASIQFSQTTPHDQFDEDISVPIQPVLNPISEVNNYEAYKTPDILHPNRSNYALNSMRIPISSNDSSDYRQFNNNTYHYDVSPLDSQDYSSFSNSNGVHFNNSSKISFYDKSKDIPKPLKLFSNTSKIDSNKSMFINSTNTNHTPILTTSNISVQSSVRTKLQPSNLCSIVSCQSNSIRTPPNVIPETSKDISFLSETPIIEQYKTPIPSVQSDMNIHLESINNSITSLEECDLEINSEESFTMINEMDFPSIDTLLDNVFSRILKIQSQVKSFCISQPITLIEQTPLKSSDLELYQYKTGLLMMKPCSKKSFTTSFSFLSPMRTNHKSQLFTGINSDIASFTPQEESINSDIQSSTVTCLFSSPLTTSVNTPSVHNSLNNSINNSINTPSLNTSLNNTPLNTPLNNTNNTVSIENKTITSILSSPPHISTSESFISTKQMNDTLCIDNEDQKINLSPMNRIHLTQSLPEQSYLNETSFSNRFSSESTDSEQDFLKENNFDAEHLIREMNIKNDESKETLRQCFADLYKSNRSSRHSSLSLSSIIEHSTSIQTQLKEKISDHSRNSSLEFIPIYHDDTTTSTVSYQDPLNSISKCITQINHVDTHPINFNSYINEKFDSKQSTILSCQTLSSNHNNQSLINSSDENLLLPTTSSQIDDLKIDDLKTDDLKTVVLKTDDLNTDDLNTQVQTSQCISDSLCTDRMEKDLQLNSGTQRFQRMPSDYRMSSAPNIRHNSYSLSNQLSMEDNQSNTSLLTTSVSKLNDLGKNKNKQINELSNQSRKSLYIPTSTSSVQESISTNECNSTKTIISTNNTDLFDETTVDTPFVIPQNTMLKPSKELISHQSKSSLSDYGLLVHKRSQSDRLNSPIGKVSFKERKFKRYDNDTCIQTYPLQDSTNITLKPKNLFGNTSFSSSE